MTRYGKVYTLKQAMSKLLKGEYMLCLSSKNVYKFNDDGHLVQYYLDKWVAMAINLDEIQSTWIKSFKF